MKVFYFIFGIITTILVCMMLFTYHFHVYLDDYYLDLIFTKYYKPWKYVYVGTAILFYICTMIAIYNIGIKNSIKEPLIIKHIHCDEEDNKKDE